MGGFDRRNPTTIADLSLANRRRHVNCRRRPTAPCLAAQVMAKKGARYGARVSARRARCSAGVALERIVLLQVWGARAANRAVRGYSKTSSPRLVAGSRTRPGLAALARSVFPTRQLRSAVDGAGQTPRRSAWKKPLGVDHRRASGYQQRRAKEFASSFLVTSFTHRLVICMPASDCARTCDVGTARVFLRAG